VRSDWGNRWHATQWSSSIEVVGGGTVSQTVPIFFGHRVLHLLDYESYLIFDPTSVHRMAVAAKLDSSTRLVDDVDRLVRLMAIVDESRGLINRCS